ncbi:MAG: hypothetical protein M1832_002625 [Thelocarpon impressellum]|nr:MAG: hypothetical protein M1832_002625 [Thelocarpon impressellum]
MFFGGMYRQSRPEGLDLASPPMSRSQSQSSERQHLTRLPSLLTPPATTSLAPAYIAASAASQIVTSDHDAQAYGWFTEEGIAPSGETALVSAASLNLINCFLDQLLYNFLGAARSTELAALRPAVLEVLKPTLAKEAIAGADCELNEYLGGDDDDTDAMGLHGTADRAADWDLELAWKQTRLRCMVYSSLGDVEEEDEDTYAEQEQLNAPGDAIARFTDKADVVSPAVAIFLTSVLEFVGEQTLIVAGQAAYQRLRSRRRDSGDPARPPTDIAERVVVEELDTEKVALNATLGRLWRTWRKRLRSSASLSSRPLSRDSPFRRHYQASLASSSRRSSFEAVDNLANVPEHSRNISLAEVLEEDIAASIPLPTSTNDVEEIEVPGLADLDEPAADGPHPELAASRERARSFGAVPTRPEPTVTPEPSDGRPVEGDDEPAAAVPAVPGRVRSRSLPPPARKLYVVSSDAGDSTSTSVTPVTPEQSPEDGPEPAAEPTSGHGAEDVKLAAADDAAADDADSSDRRASEDDTDEHVTPRHVADEKAGVPQAAGIIAGGAAMVSSAVRAIYKPQAPGKQDRSATGEPGSETMANGHAERQASAVAAGACRSAARPTLAHSASSKSVDRVGTPSGAQHRSHPSSASHSRNPSQTPPLGAPGHKAPSHISGDGQEKDDPAAIGVAHTSNVSVIRYSSPPSSGSKRSSPGTLPGDADERATTEPGRLLPVEGAEEGRTPRGDARDDLTHLVLTAPPASRSRSPRPADKSASVTDSATSSAVSSTDFALPIQSSVPEHGAAPPLTPLRELMEAAHDTSDDADSVNRSHSVPGSDAAARAEPRVNGQSPVQEVFRSPSGLHVRKVSSGKLSDQRHQPAVAPTERATVQRLHSPPMTPRDGVTPKVRRSESFGRGQHSSHASDAGSPLSRKLKGLAGRQHDDLDRQSTRSSEENRSVASDRFSQGTSRPADKQKNFEKLIESDETIQYTLTPQNMREMEASQPPPASRRRAANLSQAADRPRYQSQASEIADLADFIRNTGPEEQEPPRASSQRSNLASNILHPVRSNSGAKANNAIRSIVSKVPVQGNAKKLVPVSPQPQAPPSSASASASASSRLGGPVARDARMDRSSTRDFADFIRSTGPDQALDGPPHAAASRMGTVGRSNGGSRLASPGPKRNVLSKSNRSQDDVQSQAGAGSEASRTATTKLTAREAAARHTSTDLIDFIRQGPPKDSNATSASPGAREPVGGSRASTIVPGKSGRLNGSSHSQSMQSVTSSTNSQSALLGKQNRSGTDGGRFDGPPQPQRKQRRVKDPYAIDSDSDEDYDLTATPKPRGEEESLMDFLRNVPPSNAPTTTSVFDDVPKPKEKKLFGPARSSSAAPATRAPTGPPQITLSQGRNSPLFNGSGSLGLPSNGVKSPSPLASPAKGTGRVPQRPAGVPRKTPGPARAGRANDGLTSDLASFLKETGPPTPASTYSAPPVKDESGGFAKMFRKKKTTRVA